jgi:aminopeptidase-like protein
MMVCIIPFELLRSRQAFVAKFYRSWDRDWGFCVTKRFFDSLKSGIYEVIIETEESEGILKVLDYTHKGALEECFTFVAHLDHPGVANDDLAGCAVGVELMRKLSQINTKYSYKLLLVPEIIGSEYYWGKTNTGNKNKILEAVFLEMLGTKTQLALQESFAEV